MKGAGSVDCERSWTAAILVSATAAINIVGNLFGAVLTFVFFGILEPRLSYSAGFALLGFWDRAMVFAAVVGIAFAIIGPINGRWVWSLYREVRSALEPNPCHSNLSKDPEKLRIIGGKVLRLPVKLAGTTLAGWIIAAVVVSALPHVAPRLFPWPHHTSHQISAWLVLVGAPVTMSWVYFAQERWLQLKIPRLLPADTLLRVPFTYRINVLPKLLAVFIVMSILPVTLISHITLHQISEVQAGRQSIATFLDVVPTVIGFLLATFGAMAAGLSIVVAKSVSEPLKNVGAAMDAVRSGDLNVNVPVVSNDEIGQMSDGFNRMVKEHRELDSIRDTFGRYVSQEVVTEILKSPGGVDLMGELRDITILVADLRGFTQIADSLEPREVLELINRFLQEMTDIILSHQGTIDEFTGDGILVFFGAPRVLPDHSLRAVACALEMQEAMTHLNRENVKLGFPDLRMGIGINRGELIIGNIGSEKRKKYGAVGSPINVAFRIEAETRGGDILVSPAVRERLNGVIAFEQRAAAHLKGLDKPVTLHEPRGFIRQAKS
jgi:adenylate cyclase